MYEKYIGPLNDPTKRKNEKLQKDLDMTIATRMTSADAKKLYTDDTMNTRKTVTEQYGVNISSVSGEATRTVDGMYNELSGDNKFKVSDFEG